MPFVERTVQNYGVVVDDVHYYHDVLRRWIDAVEPGRSKVRRKFMFRRDPRDISVIWFFDPEIRTYYPIPYRDTSHPAMSLWELREAKKVASSVGSDESDERAVFRAYDRMREIEESSAGKTKAVRRAAQRRKPNADTRVAAVPTTNVVTPGVTKETTSIKPFEEMDEMTHE
jgi:putative transposase